MSADLSALPCVVSAKFAFLREKMQILTRFHAKFGAFAKNQKGEMNV